MDQVILHFAVTPSGQPSLIRTVVKVSGCLEKTAHACDFHGEDGFVWEIDGGMLPVLILAFIRAKRWQYQAAELDNLFLPIFEGRGRASAAVRFGNMAGYRDVRWFTCIFGTPRVGETETAQNIGRRAHSNCNRWFRLRNITGKSQNPPRVELSVEELRPEWIEIVLEGRTAGAREVDWLEMRIAAAVDGSFPPTLARAGVHIFGRLPSVGQNFDGRDSEMALLDELYGARETAMVEIVARSGEGKSTLCRWWLRRMEGTGGILERQIFSWCCANQGTIAASRDSPWALLSGLAASLGVSLESGRGEGETADPGVAVAAILSGLRNRSTLILFDGVEVLVSTVAEFSMGGSRISPGDGAHGMAFYDVAIEALLNGIAAGQAGESFCMVTSQVSIRDLIENTDGMRTLLLQPLPLERPAVPKELLSLVDAETRWSAEARSRPAALTLELLEASPGKIPGGKPIEVVKPSNEDPIAPELRYEILRAAEELSETAAGCLLYTVSLFRDTARWEAVLAVLRSREGDDNAHPFVARWAELTEEDWTAAHRILLRRQLVKPSPHDDIPMHGSVRRCLSEACLSNMPEFWIFAHRRLYHYYRALQEKEFPATLDEMAPLIEACWHGCQAGDYKRTFDEVAYHRLSRGAEAYMINGINAAQYALSFLSWYTNDAENFPGKNLSNVERIVITHGCALCLRYVDRLEESRSVEEKVWNRIARDEKKHHSGLPIAVSYLRIEYIFGNVKTLDPVLGSVVRGMAQSMYKPDTIKVSPAFAAEAVGYILSVTALTLLAQGRRKRASTCLYFAEKLCRFYNRSEKHLMPGLAGGFHALAMLEKGDHMRVLNGIRAGEFTRSVSRYQNTGMYDYIQGRALGMAASTDRSRQEALGMIEECLVKCRDNFQWWHATALLEKARILASLGGHTEAGQLFRFILNEESPQAKSESVRRKFQSFQMIRVDAHLGIAASARALNDTEEARSRARLAMRGIDESGYEARRKTAESLAA